MGNDTKSDESGKRLRGILDRREFLTATASAQRWRLRR